MNNLFSFSGQDADRAFSVNYFSSHFFPRPGVLSLAGLVLGSFCLGGCAPTINLATPEPVKVDVAVRLDVYQKTAPTKAKSEQSNLEVAAGRRLRTGQIQQLKNDHVVGENRDGYLTLKNPPEDPKYLAYAKGIVDAENEDRSYLYLSGSQSENKPMELIERDYAQLWRERAFPGEWVEGDDGHWTQK
jgi:uncharacterized protein YdbL (DUF1318 family)